MPVRRSASALGPSSVVHPPDRSSTGAAREAVEVRTEPVDGVETPVQLLRGGRLWLVRSAEPLPGTGRRWRVAVASGPGVPPEPGELALSEGRWSLLALTGAGTGEPAWA